MFWDKWIPSRLLTRPVVCGLEALSGDEGLTWFFSIVKKQGNQVELLDSGSVNDLKDLPKRVFSEKLPVLLCLNGRGIIIRRIVNTGESKTGSSDFLQQNLPGLNLSDFNVNLYEQPGSVLFASVQRKEQTAELVAEVVRTVPVLADVFIGASVVVALAPLLSNYNFVTPNLTRVELLNGAVDQILPVTSGGDQQGLDLEGLRVPSSQLLAFSAAFAYLTGQEFPAAEGTDHRDLKQKHLEKNKFRVALAFFLGLAFVLCLVNFVFFTTWFSKTKELDTGLSLYQDKYDRINDLLNSYEKKKSLIEEAGLLENDFFATYTDRIAASMPAEVILTDFLFNPKRESDVAEDSLMGFNKKTIVLRGNCNKSLLINEWVNVLKTQNFIRDVNLEKFLFNNDGNQPNFEIRILTE